MNCAQAKSIRIDDYLSKKGYAPDNQNGRHKMYHSMFSEDRDASFEVSPDGKKFHDWSTGIMGNIIDLAMAFNGSKSVPDALHEIGQVMGGVSLPATLSSFTSIKDVEPAYYDVEFMPLSSPALLTYLRHRAIPAEVATRYCKEIRYRTWNKRKADKFYAVAWMNQSNGCEIRNSFVKQAMAPKDVSVVGDLVACTYLVFEGFCDFLSAVVLGWYKPESMNAVVLNSTGQLPKAMPLLEQASRIICLLDNDSEGKKATATICTKFHNAVDKSMLYAEYNDVNDLLRAIRRSG